MINLAPPGYQIILSTDQQKSLSSPARMIVVVHLTGWAVEHGSELEELSVSRPSLEDLFIEVVSSPEHEGRES